MALSARQEAFCQEYVKTANAPQSYKKAGYKARNDNVANACASRLLNTDNIKARIAELTEETRREAIADIAEIQEILTSIARGETREEQIVVEGCGDGISQGVIKTRKVQERDRLKAAELLAKMRGGFDNTVNVNLAVPKFSGDDELVD